jgi:hypothetical protein
MTAVTVDLADLETIVFATGAIKAIESALASRRQDPFVRPHLDYTAAHDRLATAMRNALRAEAGTLVPFDEPLTKTELRALRYVLDATDPNKGAHKKSGVADWFVISGADKAAEGEKMSVYDRLAAKGCLQIGQFVTGVVWAGAPAPEVKADPDRGFAAKITDRGRAMLTASEAK